jgi:hypothetical protein
VTCPARFVERGEVFHEIAGAVMFADHWRIAKEVDFLLPDVAPPDSKLLTEVQFSELQQEVEEQQQEAAAHGNEAADTSDDTRSVGRIDMLLLSTDETGNETRDWCAVELQAVYFSGGNMGKEFTAIEADSGPAPPLPVGRRRPDFRSSGPKRLLPQLQIKVPLLITGTAVESGAFTNGRLLLRQGGLK